MDAAAAPAASNSTFQTGDKLVGGAGTDTLSLTVADNAAAANPLVDLDSVEVIKVRNLDTATGAVTIKADTWVGATQVWSSNSTQDVSVTGLKNIVTAGLENTNEKLTLTIVDTAVAGTADTLAIAASNAGNKATANSAQVAVTNVTGTANVIEAVTVDSTGTYNFVDIDGVGNKVKTITVTGAAETKIEADRTAVVTIDASAATGAVNVVDGANAFAGTATDGITYKGGAGADTIAVALTNKATVTAGAGNDVVALSNVANLTTADSVAGGDGTDVLSLAVADAKTVAANAARTVITGFETLRVTGNFAAAAADNFDISKFGINSLQVTGDVSGAVASTVSGFTSGATVEFQLATTQTNALNIGMKNATDAGTDGDTLNIKINTDVPADAVAGTAALVDVKVGVDGINILNVSTADSNTATKGGVEDGYSLTLSNASNVTAINATGATALSFTSGAATNALKTFDGSGLAATANLTVDLSGFGGTQGVEVKGGAGVNTITGTGLADIITGGAKDDVLVGGAGNDKISGGDGKDTITGGTGADVLAGGAGVDTFVVATGDSLVATADSITDLVFGVGGDVIKFGNTAATATNLKTLSAASQANVSAELTLAAAVNKAIVESGDAAKSAVVFTYGTDTYLLYNEATATATFADATDSLIKITGVTGTIDASNIFVA